MTRVKQVDMRFKKQFPAQQVTDTIKFFKNFHLYNITLILYFLLILLIEIFYIDYLFVIL